MYQLLSETDGRNPSDPEGSLIDAIARTMGVQLLLYDLARAFIPTFMVGPNRMCTLHLSSLSNYSR